MTVIIFLVLVILLVLYGFILAMKKDNYCAMIAFLAGLISIAYIIYLWLKYCC